MPLQRLGTETRDTLSNYIDGYDHGYLAGYTNGHEAAQAELHQRDEQLARRIVAMLLQHDYNNQLVEAVLRVPPYTDRGIPRRPAS
jgi:hypothetical protein